ncbi:hypothetical protein SARC_09394 [Sphaeroforma arctica JP610]|uniref:Uncharacterized protein n=1 Tax=Sphaeroforma arctica JP610 TaxID=667725 RepID=A0A0L0FNX7_9EUKA|nr:hypothetical protein SARC_09394 [Sphaeroforma arctica JP610]KNC78166.1 hypothetical protein SARC_09394 [Sphaeroforma arctica JP610]|eukprot:XP_014152068.1 hypothetical protein SARC_09394 [Sphaeroforma arctica JP610]
MECSQNVNLKQRPEDPPLDTDTDIDLGTPGPVDFTSVMFLSTGGATISAKETSTQTKTASRKTGKTATWEGYTPFAKRLFWTIIFPIVFSIYLSSGLVLYTATIKGWARKDAVAVTLVSIAASLSLLVTLWSGIVAYRLRKHPVVLNRGRVFIAQVLASNIVSIPVFCAYVLTDTGIFTPTNLGRAGMDICLNLTTFLYFSAVVGRQRQMVYLFCNPNLSQTPKNTYRNTVLCIGAMYIVTTIASLVSVLMLNLRIHHAPMAVAHAICNFAWIKYAYQSRHASAQFSDFHQIRRLLAINTVTVIILHSWGIWQLPAFIVQSFMVLALMVLFLLDSYLSLFYFIRYKLDPRFEREVTFSPSTGSSSPQVRVTTTVACVQTQTSPAQRTVSNLSQGSNLDVKRLSNDQHTVIV